MRLLSEFLNVLQYATSDLRFPAAKVARNKSDVFARLERYSNLSFRSSLRWRACHPRVMEEYIMVMTICDDVSRLSHVRTKYLLGCKHQSLSMARTKIPQARNSAYVVWRRKPSDYQRLQSFRLSKLSVWIRSGESRIPGNRYVANDRLFLKAMAAVRPTFHWSDQRGKALLLCCSRYWRLAPEAG